MRISKSLRTFGLLALLSPLATTAGPVDGPQCGNPPPMEFGNSGNLPPMPFGKRPFPEGIPPMQGIPFQYLDLDLSDVQQDKIIALVHPQLPVIWKMEKQRHQLLEELHGLGSTDKFDESKANEIAGKLASIEKESIYNHAKTDSQIFAILTPEQRKKLSEHKPYPEAGFRKSSSKNPAPIGSELKRDI